MNFDKGKSFSFIRLTNSDIKLFCFNFGIIIFEIYLSIYNRVIYVLNINSKDYILFFMLNNIVL